MGNAGGSFVVRNQHRLDGRILAQRGADGVGVNGVAPLKVHPQHIGAVGLGNLHKAVAESAGGARDDAVAGREGIDHRRLQGAGAAGGEDIQVVGGHKDLFEAGGSGVNQLPEFRPPVVNHRQRHFGNDVVRDGGRAGGTQVLGGNLGQGHGVRLLASAKIGTPARQTDLSDGRQNVQRRSSDAA